MQISGEILLVIINIMCVPFFYIIILKTYGYWLFGLLSINKVCIFLFVYTVKFFVCINFLAYINGGKIVTIHV